ncbi:hypothetical protein [Streptomyces sp. GESEQ-35]|uniref:phosphotriesterase family protein n=1 Tax=Streptomyces sp. GESEQ-35 TaxID=2812657 RepID=UPI001FF60986|nr:hypothetical protein [Streptomyces sp. GESEQ-35]
MRAVAQAHPRTGASITVHTSAGSRTGLVAQNVLRSEGVDLGAVVTGHSGDTADLDYLHEIIDNGSYVGMDRFGLDILLPADQRVATVATLAREGLAPNWHHTHLHDEVLPAPRRAGVSELALTSRVRATFSRSRRIAASTVAR